MDRKAAAPAVRESTKSKSGGAVPVSTSAELLSPNAEATQCLTPILQPQQYNSSAEKVIGFPTKEDVVEVPAVYETVTERVIDKPAHTTWKKGTGPIQRIDDATGEIMCLVEVPATYKIINKRVLKTLATSRAVVTPDNYKIVTD